jgi:hypothetical protein
MHIGHQVTYLQNFHHAIPAPMLVPSRLLDRPNALQDNI